MRLPSHPGRLLKAEMAARNLSANRLAMDIAVPAGRISDIVNGRRGITPDTALRLGIYFDTGPELWLTMQAKYDVALLQRDHGAAIAGEIRKPRAA
ncbi:MAG TPA: HigA family addiction module antitoxin [Dongiaceae bacterium]|nr:HigA family addiction module antitoxin [Dongiaceae bacterium]